MVCEPTKLRCSFQNDLSAEFNPAVLLGSLRLRSLEYFIGKRRGIHKKGSNTMQSTEIKHRKTIYISIASMEM